MAFLIEKRHTVGAYRAITVKENLTDAEGVVQEEMHTIGGIWQSYESKKPADGEIMSVKTGNAHNNTIIRIRQVQEVTTVKYRKQLTDDEYNAFLHYTHRIKVDSEFDIEAKNAKEDWWVDRVKQKHIKLRDGLIELWNEMVVYPLVHDVNDQEAALMAKVFREFDIISDDEMAWCMMPEEEEDQ